MLGGSKFISSPLEEERISSKIDWFDNADSNGMDLLEEVKDEKETKDPREESMEWREWRETNTGSKEK